jgi:hypothetical protein
MRSFFHSSDESRMAKDQDRAALSGQDAAMLRAAVIAARLIRRHGGGCLVCALDEHGNEVANRTQAVATAVRDCLIDVWARSRELRPPLQITIARSAKFAKVRGVEEALESQFAALKSPRTFGGL